MAIALAQHRRPSLLKAEFSGAKFYNIHMLILYFSNVVFISYICMYIFLKLILSELHLFIGFCLYLFFVADDLKLPVEGQCDAFRKYSMLPFTFSIIIMW